MALAAACLLPAWGRPAPPEEDSGGESRPVVSHYSLAIGRKNVQATYVSPLHYTGTSLAAAGLWQKAMPFAPQKAVMHFEGRLEWADLLNPAGTAQMIGLNAAFGWGMSWRHKLPHDLQLTAGGTLGLDGGAFYLLRNGNNPIQAMANVSLGLRGALSRPFRLGRLPVLVSNTLSVPSLSVFFSPQYGETYYEIYLGNHSGLVHAGWWGNNFRLADNLELTLDFGRTAMTVGYRYDLATQWANHLNTRIHTHSFVIGVVPGGIGLKKPRRPAAATTVSPLYLP